MNVSLQELEALAPSDAEHELIRKAVRELQRLWAQAIKQGVQQTASGQMIREFLGDMVNRRVYSTILRLELARRRKKETGS